MGTESLVPMAVNFEMYYLPRLWLKTLGNSCNAIPQGVHN